MTLSYFFLHCITLKSVTLKKKIAYFFATLLCVKNNNKDYIWKLFNHYVHVQLSTAGFP